MSSRFPEDKTDQFVKDLMKDHQVWARKYMTADPEGKLAVFFVVAVPKGIVVSTGLAGRIGGDVVASLVEASRGNA